MLCFRKTRNFGVVNCFWIILTSLSVCYYVTCQLAVEIGNKLLTAANSCILRIAVELQARLIRRKYSMQWVKLESLLTSKRLEHLLKSLCLLLFFHLRINFMSQVIQAVWVDIYTEKCFLLMFCTPLSRTLRWLPVSWDFFSNTETALARCSTWYHRWHILISVRIESVLSIVIVMMYVLYIVW